MGLGLVGSVAAGAYILGTDGAGAALGGTTALMFTMGEMAIGTTQMLDALVNKESNIPEGSSIPGVIAHGLKSQYANIIDGVAGLAPGVLAGGLNLKNLTGLTDAYKAFETEQSIYTTLNLYDAIADITGAVTSGFDDLKEEDFKDISRVNLKVENSSIFNKDGSKTETTKITMTYAQKEGTKLVKKQKEFSQTFTTKAEEPKQ